MALSKDNIVDWTDIETIYTNLNTARSKFSFQTVSIPKEDGNKPIPSHVSSLKDLVQNMTSNSWLTTTASTTNVVNPQTSDLLKIDQFNQLSTIIDNINNTCIHFGGDYGYNTTVFGSNYGYNTSYFSTDYSYNTAYFSGNHGYNGADFGGNNSWNSGFYGWNSGFYGWNSGFYSF